MKWRHAEEAKRKKEDDDKRKVTSSTSSTAAAESSDDLQELTDTKDHHVDSPLTSDDEHDMDAYDSDSKNIIVDDSSDDEHDERETFINK